MAQALLIPHPQKRDHQRTQASFPGWVPIKSAIQMLLAGADRQHVCRAMLW
jgi:hypothetical protein